MAYPPFGSTIPRGYALTLGQAHYIANFPDLYAIIGATYGNTGPGTFRLPKLEDQFGNPLLIYTGAIPQVPIQEGLNPGSIKSGKSAKKLLPV